MNQLELTASRLSVRGIFTLECWPSATWWALGLLLAAGWFPSAVNAQQNEPPGNPAYEQIEDRPGWPRVLLIGDSISIDYTLDVRQMLDGQANVHRPATNCGPTTNGLKNIDAWLKIGGTDKKWDVIHFNWGLHDLKYVGPNGENLVDPKLPTSRRQVPPEEYEQNLRRLVERLKTTGARLIWRNTTPVPTGARGRVPGDDVLYNQIAARVMAEYEIPTDDLYGFAMKRLEQIQLPANVHFKPEGSRALAEQVVAAIARQLASND